VMDTAKRRRLVNAGTRITQLGYATDGSDVDALIETARAEVDATSRATAEVTFVSDVLSAELEALTSEEPPGVLTPWQGLNHLIGGWRPGRMYVIAARPNVGKSILALQAAIELAKVG